MKSDGIVMNSDFDNYSQIPCEPNYGDEIVFYNELSRKLKRLLGHEKT